MTAKRWWRYGMIPIIGVLAFQILNLIEQGYYGKIIPWEKLLIGTLLVLSLILWISAKLRGLMKDIKESQNITPDEVTAYRKFDKEYYQQADIELKELQSQKKTITLKEYTKKITLFSGILRGRLAFGRSFAPSSRILLIAESAIFFVLISLPFLLYAHEFIPDGMLTFQYGILKIDSFGFIDVSTFVWYAAIKLAIFVGLTLWFFTCKYWWKYSILVPFSLLCYQLLEIFRPGATKVDEYEVWYALPVLVPLLFFMIWASAKVKYFSATYDLHEAIEKEVRLLIREIAMIQERKQNNLRVELERLQDHKNRYSPQEYLEKLENLRNKLKD